MTVLLWLVEYLASFTESVACCVFTGSFLDGGRKIIQNNKKRICLYSCFFAAIITGINLIELFSIISSIIGVVGLYLLQCFLHRKRKGFIFILTLIYAVITIAIDCITVQVGGIFLGKNTSYILETHSIQRVICIICSKLIIYTIIYFVYKFTDSRIKISQKYGGILSIVSITFVLLNYYLMKEYSNNNSEEWRLVSSLFFLVSIIFIVSAFYIVIKMSENYAQKQKIALLKRSNDLLVKYEKNTEQALNLWRSSIHDYKHKIIAMKEWIEEGNINAVKEFLDSEDKLVFQREHFIKSGNAVVDAIVNTKVSLAEAKGITFMVNAVMPKECAITEMDIVCILGNLIDNAIEACEKQDKKYVELVIKSAKKFLIIQITNSFEKELQDAKTTKKEKEMHGIGIYNVKDIVDSYDGTYEMIKKGDEVITTVMLLNNIEQ